MLQSTHLNGFSAVRVRGGGGGGGNDRKLVKNIVANCSEVDFEKKEVILSVILMKEISGELLRFKIQDQRL